MEERPCAFRICLHHWDLHARREINLRERFGLLPDKPTEFPEPEDWESCGRPGCCGEPEEVTP
jgi:hypothetical protein